MATTAEQILPWVKDKVNALLPDETFFLVEVSFKPARGTAKLSVLLDGDNGIGIDVCTSVSRALGAALEEENIISIPYTLEVGSPGIDFPLNSVRMYQKNIGRNVKLHLKEGNEVEGKLLEVSQEAVKVLATIKEKGKKVRNEEMLFLFSAINKTLVMISFK